MAGIEALYGLGDKQTRNREALLDLERALEDASGRFEKSATVPAPPLRDEYYTYLDKQRHRKLAFILQFLSVGALYGVWEICTKSPAWWPFLILIAIAVPWKIITLYLLARRPRVSLDSHATAVAHGWRTCQDSVDVFLPTAGEDAYILRNTYRHVRALQWDGKLEVYILDDAASPVVEILAKQFGFHYIVRANRGEHRKSGNLNAGLSGSEGKYVCVFDADFAPAPDFLAETVPYFLDPRVGIVQTAQYFNSSGRRTKNWLEQHASSIASTFYCWAMPSRQNSDTAFCVGTNVIYRREALQAAGGFPRVPVGEDIVTTLSLRAHGFRTVYLPLILARGVCPDTFSGAVNQQYRWCQSSFSQFLTWRKENIVPRIYREARLGIIQSIIYATSSLYYIQSALELLAMSVPALLMLWVYPWQVGPGNYLPIAPAMLGLLAMPMIVPQWRPSILRTTLVYSATHLVAIWDVIRNRASTWVPTGMRRKPSTTATRTAWLVRSWIVVAQGLAWAALARDVPVYGFRAYWIPLVLTAFQTWVFFPMLLPGFSTAGRTRQLFVLLTPRRFRA